MSDFLGAVISSQIFTPPLEPFSMSTFGSTNTTTACGYALATTRYHNNYDNPAPVNGSRVFTDAAGTTPLNGLSHWWKITPDSRILIDIDGLCSSATIC